MTKRAPWDEVRLRVGWGEVPPLGAELVTRTGRRYQVIGVRGRALRCLVLPADAPVLGPVLRWAWARRRRVCR